MEENYGYNPSRYQGENMSAGSGLFNEAATQSRFIAGKGGVAGEVDDLRKDVAKNLVPLASPTVREFINPILGAATSLRIATATVQAVSVVGTAALTGATLTNMADNPRQLVFTTAGGTAAHAPATVTVKGKDARGKSITETLALAQTAASVTTANFFSELDEDEAITYPAADGTGATVAIGIGAKLGLTYKPKSRSGGVVLIFGEAEDGSAPSAEGVVTPAGVADLPYGSYTPASALNGALDFIIAYEFDPALL
jgi:hypothetical protein